MTPDEWMLAGLGFVLLLAAGLMLLALTNRNY